MAKKIDTEKVFKQIKKQNGEKFAQVIRGDRTHDGSLLEVPNIVHILEFAGRDENDALQIRKVIQEIYIDRQDDLHYTAKSPLELLSEAGYDAFVVTTEEQKNSIKKYYRPGEEICTFRDPHRHEYYFMIHAVKRGADKIQPSVTPRREDEYGTSVISIQIAKTGGFISIKNRYNHTVSDPDATFDNNPDNIISGLSFALQSYFGVEFNVSESPLPDNYRMVRDQIVRYNYEIDNVYVGPNYYFSGSEITKIDSDSRIVMDYMILDTKIREVYSPVDDDTVKVFKAAFKGQAVTRVTNKANKTTVISAPNGSSVTVKDGKIIELSLPHVKEIGDNFLRQNDSLRILKLASVEKVGEWFLCRNQVLEHLEVPKLQIAEKDFLTNNKALKKLDLPELITMGHYSLGWNEGFESIRAPKAEKLGSVNPFQPNLKEFYAPNLPESKLEDFARNNSDVARAIAFQRVDKAMATSFQEAQERLEKMIQEAAERMKKKYCEAYANVGLGCPEKE